MGHARSLMVSPLAHVQIRVIEHKAMLFVEQMEDHMQMIVTVK